MFCQSTQLVAERAADTQLFGHTAAASHEYKEKSMHIEKPHGLLTGQGHVRLPTSLLAPARLLSFNFNHFKLCMSHFKCTFIYPK